MARASIKSPEQSQSSPANSKDLNITGQVRDEAGRAVGGLLLEATDALNSGKTIRLGSASLDTSGSFGMAVGIDPKRNTINLQIRLYAPDKPGIPRENRLLFTSEVRDASVGSEHFMIELTNEIFKKVGMPVPLTKRVGEKSSDRIKRIQETNAQKFEDNIAVVKERRSLFRGKIRAKLAASISNVTESERKSIRFVPEPSLIPSAMQITLAADIQTIVGKPPTANEPKQPSLEQKGRILLNKKQLERVIGERRVPFELSEADLEKALGISMDKPAAIFRRPITDDPCRPRTKADRCLDDLPEDAVEEGDSVGTNSDDVAETSAEHRPNSSAQPSEDGSSTTTPINEGPRVSSFAKRDSIDAIMDRQSSPEDPLIFGPNAKLEEPLRADQLGAAIAGVSLAPGPADVPALHFFNDLQMAFEPIWQEALDDRFLDDVEAVFDKFVERGGAPAISQITDFVNVVGIFDVRNFFDELFDIGTSSNNSYETVSSVIIITREEWDVLPNGAKTYLDNIADNMIEFRDLLMDSLDATPMTFFEQVIAAGTTSALMKASMAPFLNADAIELRAKLRLLKIDAEGIVALARRLLLEVEASRPFRPTHTIIEQLKQQHQRAYPFRCFAASPSYRSVNFGLQVIYKQIWSLQSYQVGELVSTIPLAPGEVRKYNRRTLRRAKRSVQEVESRFERRTGETEEKARIESEIVHRARSKTNFSLSASGSVNVGAGGGGSESGGGGGMGYSASATTTFQRDVEKHSDSVKKEFNEAIRKATEEIKSERKTEITTEDILEEEVTLSGEISNENKQISATCLFYELQRRFKVEEKIHGLQSVVFVAQEVPQPRELDQAWLVRHDWIISRVLLDPSYAPALGYVSTTLISDDVALRETREALFRQRKLVEDLKQDLSDRRAQAGLRYQALQRQIERTAESADSGGGIFGDILGGVGDIVGAVPIVGGAIEGAIDMMTGEGEVGQAEQLREGAARDAYDREQREEQEFASRTMSAIATLESMQREYTDRLSRYLSQLGQVHRLIDHIWQNILYYMQAIWAHEPDDQRFLRLKDVPVPIFKKDKGKKYGINPAVFENIVADLGAFESRWVHVTSGLGVKPPKPTPVSEADKIKTIPLSQVANIYKPTGVVGNYLVFPMFEANPITEFMMEPYVTLAEGEYGVSDPDPVGNMTLDEFGDYVCCLRRHYEQLDTDEGSISSFEKLKPGLRETLKKLLQKSRRDGDIVVPCQDGLYIEMLPGTHSVMEQYKHLHRIIDIKSAQADVRAKELENIRRAERILQGELSDPDVQAKYLFEGGAGIVGPHP